MKAIFIAITLLCVMPGRAFCDQATVGTDGAGFIRGNALYAAGDFAGAVGAYEEQVRAGSFTANLFYNLGDAYYRQGNRGRAILNYQRTLTLDPTHAEAAANLAFVRGRKPIAATASGWVESTFPWLAAAAGWLAVIGLAMLVGRGRWRVTGVALLTAGLLGCAAGVLAIRLLGDDAVDTTRAVVVADDAPALYAPADNSKVITVLTAGGELRVLSDQGAWVYALLDDGTRVWVASSKIERVVPRISRD